MYRGRDCATGRGAKSRRHAPRLPLFAWTSDRWYARRFTHQGARCRLPPPLTETPARWAHLAPAALTPYNANPLPTVGGGVPSSLTHAHHRSLQHPCATASLLIRLFVFFFFLAVVPRTAPAWFVDLSPDVNRHVRSRRSIRGRATFALSGGRGDGALRHSLPCCGTACESRWRRRDMKKTER